MDKALSRFTIDDYLKRYTKALGHLSLCQPQKTFDDVLAYIRKHNLHQEGLRLYQSDRTHYDVPPPRTPLVESRR
jgi:elongator complex protein 1